MYDNYVSWLKEGKSAAIMKSHELDDDDCRCALAMTCVPLRSPATAAGARAVPRRALPAPPKAARALVHWL